MMLTRFIKAKSKQTVDHIDAFSISLKGLVWLQEAIPSWDLSSYHLVANKHTKQKS